MRRVITVAAVMALGTITGYGQSAAPWNFVEHTVATDLRGGYHVTATDIN